MSKRTAEQRHVIRVLTAHGAKVSRQPDTSGKEVKHTYEIGGNVFTYAHGTARGDAPVRHFETDLKTAHRIECHARGIKPFF